MICHILSAIQNALPAVPIVVATSTEAADDPLAAYLGAFGVSVFRGPLEDVFERFRRCVDAYPCEWILRVCADSPLHDPRVLQAVVECPDRDGADLVTTVFPRTFPVGQNAELIRTATLQALDAGSLAPEEREHLTQVFYRNPDRYRIVNVASGDPSLAKLSIAVDTVEDLFRLERCAEPA